MLDFMCRMVEERQSCWSGLVNGCADLTTVLGLSWGHLAVVGLNHAAATAPHINAGRLNFR